MAVQDVTSKNFEEKVLNSKIPVVVDFWAVWCGPCRIFSPTIEEVSKDFEGKAEFVKINVDENNDIAAKFGIMSIPTAMIFFGGKVKATSIGAIPRDAFRRWVESNLK